MGIRELNCPSPRSESAKRGEACVHAVATGQELVAERLAQAVDTHAFLFAQLNLKAK